MAIRLALYFGQPLVHTLLCGKILLDAILASQDRLTLWASVW